MSGKIRDLFLFLILQVASVVWAGVAFSMIPSKQIAGASASAFFLIFSLFMLWRILRWPDWLHSWCFYPLCLFLFGCVIPMIWVRFTHLGQPFSELRVLGMPGPEFHHISSSTLGLMFLVTLAEVVAEMTSKKKKAK